MAKKKTEMEKKTYCDHCEHYGDTKVCGGCTSVFNEETQEYLMPTKYKHVETENGDGWKLDWDDCGLELKKPDNVNHPHHYEGSTSIECIQAMTLIFGEDTVADFCACNAFKYMWRYKNKNGMEDLKKAEWYLNKIEEFGEKCDQGKIPGYFMNITAIYRRLRTMLDELMKKEAEK